MKDIVDTPKQTSPISAETTAKPAQSVETVPDRIRGWSMRCEVNIMALSAMADGPLRPVLLEDLNEGLLQLDRLIKGLLSGKAISGFDTAELAWARSKLSEAGLADAEMPDQLRRLQEVADKVRRGEQLQDQDIMRLMKETMDAFRPATFKAGDCLQKAVVTRAAETLEERHSHRDQALKAAKQIDGITRTVRLISLNAAVEASRAGDAGRGFTVIAQEIKALSERAEQAGGELEKAIGRMVTTGEA